MANKNIIYGLVVVLTLIVVVSVALYGKNKRNTTVVSPTADGGSVSIKCAGAVEIVRALYMATPASASVNVTASLQKVFDGKAPGDSYVVNAAALNQTPGGQLSFR